MLDFPRTFRNWAKLALLALCWLSSPKLWAFGLANWAVRNNKHELLIKQTNQNSLPVHLAALFGHKDTFEYLLEETPGRVENFYCGGDGGRLLSDLIKANLYGQY